MQAEELGPRVQLVAEKLLQKAKEAQVRGNNIAAQSLTESVQDLRQAATLLVEQKQLLSTLQGATNKTFASDTATSTQAPLDHQLLDKTDLLMRLERVERMLNKKSDDVKQKGNANAAVALQQSAASVQEGCGVIREQQLQLRKLMDQETKLRARWEELCDVVKPLKLPETSDESKNDQQPIDLIAVLRDLMKLKEVCLHVFPKYEHADGLLEELNKVEAQKKNLFNLESEHSRLQKQLEEAKHRLNEEQLKAKEDWAILKGKNSELEHKLYTLETGYETQQKKELAHLHEMYDNQKESHAQLERILEAKEEEVAILKADVEASMHEMYEQRRITEQLQEEHERDSKVHEKQLATLLQNINAQEHTIAHLEVLLQKKEEVMALDPVTKDHAVNGSMDKAVVDLNVQPVDGGTEIVKLQLLLDESQELLRSEQNKSSTLEQNFEKIASDVEALKTQKAEELAELQSTYETKLRELTLANDANKDKSARLSDELLKLESALTELKEANIELKELVEGYKDTITRLCHEMELKDRELSRLEDKLEAQKAAQEEKSAGQDRVISSISLQVSEYEKIIANLEPEPALEQLTSITDHNGESMNLVRHVLIGLLERHIATKHQLLTTIHNNQQQHHDVIASLMNICNVSTGIIEEENMDTSIATLKDYIVRAKDETKELKLLLDEKKQNEESLIDEMKAKITLVEGEKTALDVKLRDTCEQVSVQQSEIKQLQTQNADLQENIEILRAQQVSAIDNEAVKEELETLRQNLMNVENDFERYRARSHAALKKIEKRAELLNGMRKENDTLAKRAEASNQRCIEMEAVQQHSRERLQEVERTLEMQQAEFEQQIMEKIEKITTLEDELHHTIQLHESQIEQLSNTLKTVEAEKVALVETNSVAIERAVAEKDAELMSLRSQIQEMNNDLVSATNENQRLVEELNTSTVDLDHLRSQAQSLQQKLQQLEVSMSTVEGNAEKESEVAVLRNMNSTLEKELSHVRKEQESVLNTLRSEKASLETKCVKLEAQVQHIELELAASTHEVSRLSHLLQQDAAHVNGIESGTHVSTSEKMENDLMGSVSHDHVINSNVADLEISRLCEEIAGLSAQREKDHNEVNRLRSIITEYERRIAASDEEENQSSGDRAEITSDDAALTRERAKDEALKDLRKQIMNLQDRLHVFEEEKAASELEEEHNELKEMQESRSRLQKSKEYEIKLKQRELVVENFKQQLSAVVDLLAHGLEEHTSAFRDACAFRDEHGDGITESENISAADDGEVEYEEYLMLNSGVVIKAGSNFHLPVVCEKQGWRVVWKFSVKEEAADVGFTLMVDGQQQPIVAPDRVHTLSGTFEVPADVTTIIFQWDNAFSWLNEKTLDYHVSIQEPLSIEKKRVKVQERTLETIVKRLREGIQAMEAEAARRHELKQLLERLTAFEKEKESHLQMFTARKQEILEQKSTLQQQMEELKVMLTNLLSEQDQIQDDVNEIVRAWEHAITEREDVEMTLRLAETNQFEAAMQKLTEKVTAIDEKFRSLKQASDDSK